MEPPEKIDAGAVQLERWQPEHAERAVAAIRESLPELQRFLPWAVDGYGLEDSLGFIAMSVDGWNDGSTFNYAMVEPGGAVVGGIGLMTRMGPGVLEIGYWTRTSYAGRGLMTASVLAVTDAALALPGIERVAIRHDAVNAASAAVAIKAGFAEVRREPQESGAGIDVIRERG